MAFDSVPWLGYLFSGMFYILLFLAALTSAISLHESVTAYVHENWHMPRKKAATLVSVATMLLGVICSLSFGLLSGWTLFGMNIFDLFDSVSSKILLPIGGILIALFVGWYLDRKLVYMEVTNNGTLSSRFFGVLLFLIRWVAPIAITSMFVEGLFEML
jgi:NSS family neurotransmitter:Na+ symporter